MVVESVARDFLDFHLIWFGVCESGPDQIRDILIICPLSIPPLGRT